jgi:hypothetical protein
MEMVKVFYTNIFQHIEMMFEAPSLDHCHQHAHEHNHLSLQLNSNQLNTQKPR